MRLRYLAAGPLVAAAMFGTTAAAWPSSTAAMPQAPPALTASALSARYAADAQAIAGAERTAARDSQLAGALASLRTQHVLFFNPNGQGVAAMVIGNLATATRVAILVPGSDTTLATFFSRGSSSPGGGAEALAAEAHRLEPFSPGERLAIIAWLGYPTPATLSPAVMTSGDASQGAQALRPLVTALAQHGDQVALLCHSYGSVVCGLAAPHLPVTDIAVFGSPGMDASSVASLHTKARVWAGQESGDPIKYVPHIRLLGLGFGADPMSPGFGARIFATGTGGHSGYLDPGSVSLRNLTYIALGDPAAVTR